MLAFTSESGRGRDWDNQRRTSSKTLKKTRKKVRWEFFSDNRKNHRLEHSQSLKSSSKIKNVKSFILFLTQKLFDFNSVCFLTSMSILDIVLKLSTFFQIVLNLTIAFHVVFDLRTLQSIPASGRGRFSGIGPQSS